MQNGILGIFCRYNGQVPSEPPIWLVAVLLQRDLHSLRVEIASHLETEKEGECECLGVWFQMVSFNFFFAFADGYELGEGSCVGERENFDFMKLWT